MKYEEVGVFYCAGFHEKISDQKRKELAERGIFHNAREKRGSYPIRFETEEQAKNHIASLSKEIQKYYEVRERMMI